MEMNKADIEIAMRTDVLYKRRVSGLDKVSCFFDEWHKRDEPKQSCTSANWWGYFVSRTSYLITFRSI